MVTDPAWNMPFVNWMPQGSFEAGEIAVTEEPDAGDVVCLPPINRHWLPLVQGCLDQMRNPSTWLVPDEDAMTAVLARVDRLKQLFGQWGVCMTYVIRFDGGTCQLQQSVDGGTTWTEVVGWSDFASCLPPQTQIALTEDCRLVQSFDGGATFSDIAGWIEYFASCVQGNTPIIGLPPNPGDQTPNQLACSIATYIANQIVLAAMDKAVTGIQDDLSLLAIGASILDIIPEFILVRLGYDAISVIYADVAEGTLSDYEGALTDSSLWLAVACAIYAAIVVDGYVTQDNFSAIVANVGMISYAHSDVISAIVDYLNSLGATGLAQLSQGAGLETGADCSSCGWCHEYDFTVDDGGWSAYPSEDGDPAAVWVAGVGWTQYYPPTGATQCRIFKAPGVWTNITHISMDVVVSDPSSCSPTAVFTLSGTAVYVQGEPLTGVTAPFNAFWNPGFGGDTIVMVADLPHVVAPVAITRLVLEGTGTDPFVGYPCG